MADNTPHVFKAIGAVQRELATVGIGKDRQNAAQGYNFRGVDDVLTTLSGMLADNGLCITMDVEEVKAEVFTNTKGNVQHKTIIRTSYRALSTVDGSSVDFGGMVGESFDSGDKAGNKAMSNAFKYMAFLNFCIPLEGVLDEADAASPHIEAAAPTAANAPTPAPKAKAAPKPKKAPAKAAAAPETPAEPAPAPEAGDKFAAVLEAVESCKDLEVLKGLRSQVAALSGHIRYGELKDAFTYIGKQLTTKA